MEYYKDFSLEPIKYFCEFDLVWKIEEWRSVVGYEGIYEVSDLGRIKSLEKTFWSVKNNSFSVNKSFIRKQSFTKKLYLRLGLMLNFKQNPFLVHRLVAIAFIPNPENKPEINHKNGIKTHNFKMNLEWNTTKENVIHSFETGLSKRAKGEDNKSSKLSHQKAFEIRKSNLKNKELANIYGVSISTIELVKSNKIWVLENNASNNSNLKLEL